MIPNSAADRRFLAEKRDTVWADWCEADVMRRIWGITTWSDTIIEEIACRSLLCRVVVNMPTPGVLASLYTNIVIHHLYGDGVTPLEWNELAAPHGRSRAVFYLEYRRPAGASPRAVNHPLVPR
ncbi:MAG: hypothetical protein H0T79_13500, partial [Deltaproteobacteria bacterium]|nr:hypothetical protein [Deltaproteobacteria bacterium]